MQRKENPKVPVYPRVCGGTEPCNRLERYEQGLSPRVRGNRRAAPGRGPSDGSIPACAGEPALGLKITNMDKVYPRVCGGTVTIDYWAGGHVGLSPRVRGNLADPAGPRRPPGSIPACAGEPAFGRGKIFLFWVYPRVCGGTLRTEHGGITMKGLSPRVRGNLLQSRQPLNRPRSIPACAGEPTDGSGRCRHDKVYPRVCGGTGWITDCWSGPPRSIPACAGEPVKCDARPQ